MRGWVNKDTEIYCSFARQAGNTGCQMMNSAFYYYGLNKIYKSFSVDSIEKAVQAVRVLNIKGFAITMPYKIEVLQYVDDVPPFISDIGAANTVINTDGVLKAYNTDYNAAQTVLQRRLGHELTSTPGSLHILGPPTPLAFTTNRTSLKKRKTTCRSKRRSKRMSAKS